MQPGLDRLIGLVERAVVWLAALGGVVVIVQMVWITYGVFTRYALRAPDRMVTEATALLLFPVAFAGLAYAMREDAYPKVTMLTDTLSPLWRKVAAVVNLCVMLGVGLFFSLAAVSATIRSFNSGSSSEILLWPRYAFWAPGALALLLFSLYAGLRLIRLLRTPAREV
ncbi:TRAP transporter small permease [Roseovarius autotrophicus]|uniref:TRAP transporter small permease n=1 Tax=Roseovarius autotrophicus TaxID=2824121 RepID=UPI001A0B633D|nr:TRAP transporter small permease subunit [Roseovarius autotrophicus]MBE0453223.1 TRAP transporter small permease subunit [Roseovarius sp.]